MCYGGCQCKRCMGPDEERVIALSQFLDNDAEQRRVINTLNDLVKAKEARCDRYQVEITKLRETLTALHALVKGECPRLLNEDNGGDAQLDMEIEQTLKEQP